MEANELIKIIEFIENYYHRKLTSEEIKALKNELNCYNYKTFLEQIKPKLLSEVKYFTIAQLHKILTEKQNTYDDFSNINLNSCYWYEIEREFCEKNNIPYYDITTGEPLQAYKTVI